MTDVSSERPKITAGLDLGDKYSYLCLIDTESGEVMEEGRLRTTPEAFERRFASEQPMRIAIETGTHSPWVSRLLEECGHEVLVANARKLRFIYANKRKTDQIDAKGLLEAFRNEDIHPVPVKSIAQQSLTALHRIRSTWIATRTSRINTMRGLLREFGITIPVGAQHVLPQVARLLAEAESAVPDLSLIHI